MATCTNAESVIDAANSLKANAALINQFVNGTAVQTVQLGTGSPTPTLRKFISDMQTEIASALTDPIDVDELISLLLAIPNSDIDALFSS